MAHHFGERCFQPCDRIARDHPREALDPQSLQPGHLLSGILGKLLRWVAQFCVLDRQEFDRGTVARRILNPRLTQEP